MIETLQKSWDHKVNSAKSAVQKELRKSIAKDISNVTELDIRDATGRIEKLQQKVKHIQETVADVIR